MRGLRVRPLAVVIVGLAVAIPLFLLLLRSQVHSMTYPAPRVPVGSPPPGFVDISLALNSSETSSAWFFAGTGHESRPVVLYFHGNGENLETLKVSGWLDTLKTLGWPALAVEYPGYGRSSGRASERSNLRAASAAVRWVEANHPDRGWIAAGWSLGAAVAVQAAAQDPDHLRGLVVLSGWSSLPEMAAVHFPGWLTRPLLSEKYDSMSAAARVRCPVLVIHGEDDTIIPAALGKKLASSFVDARYVLLPSTGHNDLLSNPGVPVEMATFLHTLAP